MMLTQKTDLTDNRVFSGGLVLANTPLLVATEYDEEMMDYDTYAKRVHLEGFFGRKGHPVRKRKIFPEQISRYRLQTNCKRCGQPMVPWKFHYAYCPKCDTGPDERTRPWLTTPSASDSRNTAYNLFRLR